MRSKLQELTEKLYNDGISKANTEADTIIADAKTKAESILKEAKNDASKIISDAEKKAEEMKKNADSEIKLATNQAISALKQKVTNLVVTKSIDSSIKDALNDKGFIKTLIETAIKNWKSAEGNTDLSILLPEKDQKEFEKLFNAKAGVVMSNGATIEFDALVDNGFQIGPKDGSYKISFTDNDFENFFKGYLKPKTAELLYGGSK